ncbi:MAG: hypothetical protein HC769_07910, partial [Cyanobacteria bacterium CRU_2_1]|nr:hypothetical protein [Cyanobacteria bacterium CRU_2_1]
AQDCPIPTPGNHAGLPRHLHRATTHGLPLRTPSTPGLGNHNGIAPTPRYPSTENLQVKPFRVAELTQALSRYLSR